jgi:hypothetical protein
MNEELLAARAFLVQIGALLVSHNFFAFAQWIRFKQRTTRYVVFCSVGHLIQSGSMESCLAAQKRFL